MFLGLKQQNRFDVKVKNDQFFNDQKKDGEIKTKSNLTQTLKSKEWNKIKCKKNGFYKLQNKI